MRKLTKSAALVLVVDVVFDPAVVVLAVVVQDELLVVKPPLSALRG